MALVTSPEGELYLEAFGEANAATHVPMERDAIFRIASMTKPITSVAAMMMYEEGKLALDEPVSKYLPGYETRPVVASFDASNGTVTTRPASRPVTIRHLLTHTSGIGYSFSSPVLAALEKSGTRDADFPLLHDPGEKWTYGPNTQVLGRVVEALSGEPLDSFFRKRIFEPLGMIDTFYRIPDDRHPRLVTRHQRKNGELSETPNTAVEAAAVRGDGGLSSDARDYGAFSRMILNGGAAGGVRLLKAETLRSMMQNQIGGLVVGLQPTTNPALVLPFPIAGAGRDRFGFGFQIAAVNTSARSRGSAAWAGIYNTYFWIDPRARVGVVLLMQVLPFGDPACVRVVTGFEDRLYRALRSRATHSSQRSQRTR